MKTSGTVILCFMLQLASYAQTDAQNSSVILFYTTDTAGPAGHPVVYSNDQKIGEVTKGQLTRFVVQPGTYQFALGQRAGAAQQLSVSVGAGQELYLRVTRTAFFEGNAAEAIASVQTVTPTSVPAQLNRGVPTPELLPQPVQTTESAKGVSGVLRCAFSGTLSVHATGQPGSPVVAGLRCGDPVVVIDPRFNSFHVRTQDGKDGYIIGANLGQWLIETGTAGRATRAAIPSNQPSSTTTHPVVQVGPQTPTADLPRPGSTASLPTPADPVIPVAAEVPRATADVNEKGAPVQIPDTDPIAPVVAARSKITVDLNAASAPESLPAADPITTAAAGSRTPADLKPASTATPSPAEDPVSPVDVRTSRTTADLISPPDRAPSATAFLSKLDTPETKGISSSGPDKTNELSAKGNTAEPAPSPDRKSELSPDENTIEVGGKTYKDYVIGPGDVLSIVVWGEPNLSTKATVRSDGKIALALLDEIQASGLTPIQLKERITIALKKYLNDPNVYLIPLEVHSQYVYIVGSVGKPGIYPLDTSMRVTELLVRAGGFAEFAKPENIVIVRRSGNTNARLPFNYKRFLEGKAYEQDVVLQSGDMVIVP